MNSRITDLKAEIASRRVVIVVGTGVSVAASGGEATAGWTGFLEHGVSRVEELRNPPPAGWGDRMRAALLAGAMEERLFAAQQIIDRLGGPSSGDFSAWLRATVGSLTLRDPAVITALGALGAPIATTNYDDLLESGLPGRPPAIPWTADAEYMRVLRGQAPGVLHLHGHWRTPGSMVLGQRSYDEMCASSSAQAVLRALATMHTLLFVGYGAGLADPNFSGLLRWIGDAFRGAEHVHYRLALNAECADVQAQHPLEDRIQVLGYGEHHEDLAGFLHSLAPGATRQADDHGVPGDGPRPDAPRAAPASVVPPSPPSVAIAPPPATSIGIQFNGGVVVHGDVVGHDKHVDGTDALRSTRRLPSGS